MKKDEVIIRGLDHRIIVFGTSNEVYEHTREIPYIERDYAGFVLADPGGFQEMHR